jgi:hypothetical protein
MHFFSLNPTHPNDSPEEHPLMISRRPMEYANEGSEFLDDALGIEDLPESRTEEIVAASAPRNLL